LFSGELAKVILIGLLEAGLGARPEISGATHFQSCGLLGVALDSFELDVLLVYSSLSSVCF